MISKVVKRDGRVVNFDSTRITHAIYKAGVASGGITRERAGKISDQVILLLEENFGEKNPTVEEIQDLVEKTLIKNGEVKIAKAYILYRKQHADIRDVFSLLHSNELVDDYLTEADWRVKENANMTYSLQGLNFHISSIVISNYWLNKIYPTEISEAHKEGDFHIHDLGILGPYCVGWDLKDLLLSGFGHVYGKTASKPAKHLRTALGQAVNFFYTLQGEAAGAQAFSNFDTYLSPFIRYDDLEYEQVKQAMQEFVFNINVPTRVGFQCLSEDTAILTPSGWKKYFEVGEGDIIYSFNTKTGNIEEKPVKHIFVRRYKGIMYNIRNRIQDQLVTPEHRIVRKLFSTTEPKFVLERIEEVMKLKSPVIIPLAGKNIRPDAEITDNEIKLLAWVIAEGTIEKPTHKHRMSGRLSLVQSATKNGAYCAEITELLDNMPVDYSFTQRIGTQYSPTSLINRWRLNAVSSSKIRKYFGGVYEIKFIPTCLKNLSERQARLFIETYRKADGQKERFRISTTDERILSGLQQIIVDAGFGFTTVNRGKTKIGKKNVYVISIITHPETYVNDIRKIEYEGIVWCPNTDNETVIAIRNGKTFITGNTPFTNITLDLTVPNTLKEDSVIIGGKLQEAAYGDFQEEMDLFNSAFAEVMLEGDAEGRVFTFPIPTYNITKDFEWDNPVYRKIFEMTAKYGIPYFSNFINSDMKPEDARSMCIAASELMVYKKDGTIHHSTIKEMVESNALEFDGEWARPTCDIEVPSLNPSTMKMDWKKVKQFLKVRERKAVIIKTRDGKRFTASENHLVTVLATYGLKEKMASEIMVGDYLLSIKDGSSLLQTKNPMVTGRELDEKLAFLLGFFTADGNFLWKSGSKEIPRGLQFSFNAKDTKLLQEVKSLIAAVWGVEAKVKKDPRYNTVYLYVYRKKIADWLLESKFRKYGELPDLLFNAPKAVILAFLNGFFKGYGYEKRNEIHINDEELAEDLVLLYSLAGIPTIYRKRKNSQFIYLQTRKNDTNSKGLTSSSCLFECVPGFLAKSTYVVPGLSKNRLVGAATLQKYSAHTKESLKVLEGHVYPVRVVCVGHEDNELEKEFFDLELEENHLFLHSLGTITHNCCRLRLDNRELRKRGGGLFGANPLTGSVGVITLNLARIGYSSKDESQYFEKLDGLMELGKNSLEIKRSVLEAFTSKGLYPYSKYYLRTIKENYGSYWKNHFSTIGLLGMNESLQNFLHVSIADEEGKKFALRVLEHMRNRLSDFQNETGNIYNLEATPGEGTTYRFAKLDKAKYPSIIVANQGAVEQQDAAPYYTNSSHLPVNHTSDIFEALEHQDDLQIKYTGGTVLHGFIGERIGDWRSARELVKKIAENFRLPYFTLTPTFSICPTHGYLSGEHEYCPKCDEEIGFIPIVNERGELK